MYMLPILIDEVQKAVDTCIENDILKDFLLANKQVRIVFFVAG